MRRTLPDDHAPSGGLRAIVTSLAAAAVFEALTVLETEDKTVRAASPWQDDPYDTVVSLAQFTVPMLALVIGLRLLAWRQPGGLDRTGQLVRAAAAMTALAGLTVACEWAAVAAAVHRPSWNDDTGALITGLAATSLLVGVAVILLTRCRCPRDRRWGWRHDWLGDVIWACSRLPVVRRWATEQVAAWVRGHAMSVFNAASVVAAAGVTGALAAGERWTSPLLIGWAAVAEITAFLAFCLISNAIAGFIVRPARALLLQVTEAAVMSGGVAIQVTIAFRDALWHLIRGGPLTSIPDLVGLTLGAGAATACFGGMYPIFRRYVSPSAERLPGNHPLSAPRPGLSSQPTGCGGDTGGRRPSPGLA